MSNKLTIEEVEKYVKEHEDLKLQCLKLGAKEVYNTAYLFAKQLADTMREYELLRNEISKPVVVNLEAMARVARNVDPSQSWPTAKLAVKAVLDAAAVAYVD